MKTAMKLLKNLTQAMQFNCHLGDGSGNFMSLILAFYPIVI